MKGRKKMDKTTTAPITIDGWYEHTDGSWGEYAWGGDPYRPRLLRTADHPETAAERETREQLEHSEYVGRFGR